MDKQTDTIIAYAALHYVLQQKIISLNAGCNPIIMITAQKQGDATELIAYFIIHNFHSVSCTEAGIFGAVT